MPRTNRSHSPPNTRRPENRAAIVGWSTITTPARPPSATSPPTPSPPTMSTPPPSPERQRKRPRPAEVPPPLDTETPSPASSSDTSGVSAWHSALQAELATGSTAEAAVTAVLGPDPPSHPALPRVTPPLDLSAPVLAALRTTPQLASDLHAVARMCNAVFEMAADDLSPGPSRQLLNLRLSALSDVANLIASSDRIIALTGAGVSVSCGIPDFRSKGGLYDTALSNYGLSDPQAIFDLAEFKLDPRLFYSFAKKIMPSKTLSPSPTHRFVAELDSRGKLLRNYSQNIDGLECRAGVSDARLVLCHGSFLTATCMRKTCAAQISGDDIAAEVAQGVVPLCRECSNSPPRETSDDDDDSDMNASSMGALKPDIVFFGENLPDKVGDNLQRDIEKADLLLVLGTSLQVAPVAHIPRHFPDNVPRILVNRELVGYDFDVELLGDCDVVTRELRKALNWPECAETREGTSETEPMSQKGTRSENDGKVDETAKYIGNPAETRESGKEAQPEHVVIFKPPRQFLFRPSSASAPESVKSSGEGPSNQQNSETVTRLGTTAEGAVGEAKVQKN